MIHVVRSGSGSSTFILTQSESDRSRPGRSDHVRSAPPNSVRSSSAAPSCTQSSTTCPAAFTQCGAVLEVGVSGRRVHGARVPPSLAPGFKVCVSGPNRTGAESRTKTEEFRAQEDGAAGGAFGSVTGAALTAAVGATRGRGLCWVEGYLPQSAGPGPTRFP